MPEAATLAESLEPLRLDPARAAVLLDVDGTLAPIVRHASDAHVPEATRSLLIAVARRYGTVACVSGRRASVARRIVSIGSIAYVGNHGCEVLRPGGAGLEIDPAVAAWTERVEEFTRALDDRETQRVRIRLEDKGPISGFHWRGAPDEEAARARIEQIAHQAQAAGLAVHWGRKVLEVRPPVAIDKGLGIEALVGGADLTGGVYVGDDKTDVDAFRGLRGVLGERCICVGVRSDETPAELELEADIMVDGTRGVRRLLDALLDSPQPA